MDIQWYPGHMTKARREIQENLKLVDVILELIDARVPYSGRNPDIRQMGEGKSRVILLNKADMADPDRTEEWLAAYRAQGAQAAAVNARQAKDKKTVMALLQEAGKAKRERDQKRGIRRSQIRVLVAGIPNVGKSTWINTLAGRASTKTGDRPGVTRGQQWIHLGQGIDLLDTPGLLWPKFEDKAIGTRLAWIGSIRDEILETRELATSLLNYLRTEYPGAVQTRYGIPEDGEAEELLIAIARVRGCLRAGDVPDAEKAAQLLLEEFRHAKLGRITLERPQA